MLSTPLAVLSITRGGQANILNVQESHEQSPLENRSKARDLIRTKLSRKNELAVNFVIVELPQTTTPGIQKEFRVSKSKTRTPQQKVLKRHPRDYTKEVRRKQATHQGSQQT